MTAVWSVHLTNDKDRLPLAVSPVFKQSQLSAAAPVLAGARTVYDVVQRCTPSVFDLRSTEFGACEESYPDSSLRGLAVSGQSQYVAITLLGFVAWSPVGSHWRGTAHPGPMAQGITVPLASERPLRHRLKDHVTDLDGSRSAPFSNRAVGGPPVLAGARTAAVCLRLRARFGLSLSLSQTY